MGPLRRAAWGLFALNPATLWLLLRRGKTPAVDYLSTAVRVYRGYGKIPFHWDRSSWRSDFLVPKVSPNDVFPEIDFLRGPEILFPYPRELSVKTHELVFLCQLVRSLRPKRVLEFGTADGRTIINLAIQAPEDTELITVNAPLKPPGVVGSLYKGHPLQSRIQELLVDLTNHDWSRYKDAVDFVFCDACDSFQGVAIETAIAFLMIRQGGTVLWHDYGSGEGRTQYLNRLARDLPLRNIQDTCLVCLRINTRELLEEARRRSYSAVLTPHAEQARAVPEGSRQQLIRAPEPDLKGGRNVHESTAGGVGPC